MTITEWLTEWKDILNEHGIHGQNVVKNVERIASIYENSDDNHSILGDTSDSRISVQYEAFLTDPRRI